MKMKLNKEEEAVKASSSFLKTSSIESRFHSISHSIPENAHPKLFETLQKIFKVIEVVGVGRIRRNRYLVSMAPTGN
jgi:hypothetical protein